jgi:hypothetical protein
MQYGAPYSLARYQFCMSLICTESLEYNTLVDRSTDSSCPFNSSTTSSSVMTSYGHGTEIELGRLHVKVPSWMRVRVSQGEEQRRFRAEKVLWREQAIDCHPSTNRSWFPAEWFEQTKMFKKAWPRTKFSTSTYYALQ